MMRHWIVGLCLVAAAPLAGCSFNFEPPESTQRAIDNDISAAQNTGATTQQLGQASVVPDVIQPRSGSSIVPTVTIPITHEY